MDKDTIVNALRCGSTVRPADHSCAGCPFLAIEPVQVDFPMPADIEIDGVKYWASCDGDAIMQAAADFIEGGTES